MIVIGLGIGRSGVAFLANSLNEQRDALYYARLALAATLTVRWAGYAGYLTSRASTAVR